MKTLSYILTAALAVAMHCESKAQTKPYAKENKRTQQNAPKDERVKKDTIPGKANTTQKTKQRIPNQTNPNPANPSPNPSPTPNPAPNANPVSDRPTTVPDSLPTYSPGQR